MLKMQHFLGVMIMNCYVFYWSLSSCDTYNNPRSYIVS